MTLRDANAELSPPYLISKVRKFVASRDRQTMGKVCPIIPLVAEALADNNLAVETRIALKLIDDLCSLELQAEWRNFGYSFDHVHNPRHIRR